ncbi:hypothetical protein NKG05_04670 [Oerskovia sp. M15]
MTTEDTSPEPPAGSSSTTGAPQQPVGAPPFANGPTPGGPTPTGDPTGRPTGMDGFFDAVRRLGISRSEDRWVGGVAAGSPTGSGSIPDRPRSARRVGAALGSRPRPVRHRVDDPSRGA